MGLPRGEVTSDLWCRVASLSWTFAADGLGTGVSVRPGASPPLYVQRRLTPDDVAKVAAAYEAGATAKELGAPFGVHRQTVIAHLEKAKVPIRRGRRLLPEEVAARLCGDGWSAARLGRRYEVSGHTIRGALRKQGVEHH
jgi:hypothetical protein